MQGHIRKSNLALQLLGAPEFSADRKELGKLGLGKLGLGKSELGKHPS